MSLLLKPSNSVFGPSTVDGALTITDGVSTDGKLILNPGNNANTGYVQFIRAGGIRAGYLGYDGSNIGLQLENSSYFRVMGGNVGIDTATMDPFSRSNGRSVSIASSSDTGMQFNAATGQANEINFGAAGSRRSTIYDTATGMGIGTLGSLSLSLLTANTVALSIDSSQVVSVGSALKVGTTGTGAGTLTLGPTSPSVNGSGFIYFQNSSTQKNWKVSTNDTQVGAFEIAQSTLAGGSIWASPVFTINSSGTVLLTNNLVLADGKYIQGSIGPMLKGLTTGGTYLQCNNNNASDAIHFLSYNGTEWAKIADLDGRATFNGQVTLGLTLKNNNATYEVTGAGSAALGTNCPAVTPTAPYKWLEIIMSDGSAVYIPCWK